MAKKKYWAGFLDGHIAECKELHGDCDKLAAVYIRRKDAKKFYEDVRPVEIKEIK